MNTMRDDAVGLFGWPFPPVSAPPGRLCVLGAPSDTGNAIRRGAADAPAALRVATREGAGLGLADAGWDHGDIPPTAREHPEHYMQRLGAAVDMIAGNGHVPLLLGGDHSLSFAAIEALQRRGALCVVWLDAHTDFSPWQPGNSHNHRQVLRRVMSLPGVASVVQIGYRGITVGDERQLGPRAKVMTTHQVRGLPVATVVDWIPAHMPIYLSLDVDVVDPQWLPGTSAPVPDGLQPAHVQELMMALVGSKRLVGMDLMELNPRLDIDGRSTELVRQLLECIAAAWPQGSAGHEDVQERGQR